MPTSKPDLLTHERLVGAGVERYIHKIGFYYTASSTPRFRQRDRTPQREIINALLGPYYGSENKIDTEGRLEALEEVLDSACDFGMKIIGYPLKVETRWEERKEDIVCFPSLYSVEYKYGKFDQFRKISD